MAQRSDVFDLAALGLAPGEGRRFDLAVGVDPFDFGGQTYTASGVVPARLEISKLTGGGHALRLSFSVDLDGPCQRCLEPATLQVDVDAREVEQPGGGEELSSPYVDGSELDVHVWARDALALALPSQIVCREDCAGLCPVCGANLNAAGSDHAHESERDPRWAKLDQIRFE
ncbi:MAG TPA: DUF177 domain-containing protein [Solirubrobacteraceae bacterium]|nr:DUF177 domain-containing protein [Solirubrobacteraceae bacterium]